MLGNDQSGGTGLVTLTNASFLLSGDHEGTLSVPCPPKSFASTRISPPATGIRRSITSRFSGCSSGITSLPKLMKTIHFPSGERCGNQFRYSSATTGCCSEPSGFMRQISIVPLRSELK